MLNTGRGVEHVFVIICTSFLFSVAIWTMLRSDTNNVIYVNLQSKPISVVSKRFLSVGVDTVEISHGLNDLHLNSPKLIQLTSLLGAGHLRLGGTMADRLIFTEHSGNSIAQTKIKCNETSCDEKDFPFFTIKSSEWLQINDFCTKTNFRLLFDFNVLLRRGGKWDPTNAIQLLKFSRSHNLSIDWQLGNEPNSFKHVFNVTISPHQLSKDFMVLKRLLNEYFPGSLLVGPDTTRPQPKRPDCVRYMKRFLLTASSFIDAIAWHQYYLNGHIATLEDFWNPDTFDLLQFQIDTMLRNIMPYKNGLDMWLTETSSAYGGGAPGISNTFSSSPLWLDKLGVAALNGIQVVVRQSLIGANYSLIDKQLNPLPDWWLSFLYKSLVGEKVMSCLKITSKFQRLYCHCTAKSLQQNGGMIIYGINLANSKVDITLAGTALNLPVDVDEFILTAPHGNRKSKQVYLNGVLLSYNENFPKIVPKYLGKVGSVRMQPYSLGFWILHDVNVAFCQN